MLQKCSWWTVEDKKLLGYWLTLIQNRVVGAFFTRLFVGWISAGAGSVDGLAATAAASAAGAAGAAAGSGELAEDMLQMALRMASEMTEEPVMDLEDSVNPAPVRRGLSCLVVIV